MKHVGLILSDVQLSVVKDWFLTEGGTDKNHPGQNLPDKETPGQKTSRTIETEFVQGAFVRVFCTRPTKIRGVWNVWRTWGFPGMCDKVWQGRGFKIGQKQRDILYGRLTNTSSR